MSTLRELKERGLGLQIKVLVIDDSSYNRSFLKATLGEIEGVGEVKTAVDGLDGFRETIRFSPDLILLDLEMPGMDGFNFLRLLRGVNKDVPVVVLTGRPWEGNARATLTLGATDFIEKPAMHPPNPPPLNQHIEKKDF